MLPFGMAPALVTISTTSPARLTLRTTTLMELTARYPTRLGFSDAAGATGMGTLAPDVANALCSRNGFGIVNDGLGNCRIGTTSTPPVVMSVSVLPIADSA